MKTMFRTILSLLAVLSFAAAASAADPKFLRYGTASLGGNTFPQGAAICSLIEQKLPGVKATAQATGGSAFNMVALQAGELEFGHAQSTAVKDAIAVGKGDKLTTVLMYNANPQHIMVNKAAGVKNISDLKGKKLEMLAAGDGVEVSSRIMLEAFGIKWNEITPVYSGNRVQAASALKTGAVDGIIDATGVGAAWITDIVGDGTKFDFIPLTEAQIKALTAKAGEFSRMDIPANGYKGQTADVPAVGVYYVMVARSDLSEGLVYNITKTIFENKDYLLGRHKFFSDLKPGNILTGLVAPLHPGAAKYYKEVGVLK
jgi:TRAP transporter TAXI family solute receptor